MDDEQRQHLEGLLQTHFRRLRPLERQVAQFGARTDPQVLNEIEDIRKEILRIQRELGISEASSDPIDPMGPYLHQGTVELPLPTLSDHRWLWLIVVGIAVFFLSLTLLWAIRSSPPLGNTPQSLLAPTAIVPTTLILTVIPSTVASPLTISTTSSSCTPPPTETESSKYTNDGIAKYNNHFC